MEWINKKNKLPEIGKEVLVYFNGSYSVMMRIKYTNPQKGETYIKWSDGNKSYEGIEAWMLLPRPPTSDNSDYPKLKLRALEEE